MAKKSTLSRWLALTRQLLECPTAPLMEETPVRHILDFAAARPALAVRRDPSGNLLLGYPRSAFSATAPLVLVAHLDHPGFWVEARAGATVRLRFRGGVNAAHAVPGTRLAFFRRGERAPTGKGVLDRVAGERGRSAQSRVETASWGLQRAWARVVSGVAEPGGFAMWDLPAFRLEPGVLAAGGRCGIAGGRIYSRCCDDLVGAAAILCVLDELARRRTRGVNVWGLFTRAEEVGFYGALMAVRHRIVPRGARVISLECSRAFAHAPQGAGVAIRVGDRASLFDATFTEALRQAAKRVQGRLPDFRYQRKLMDGGTCEATVFCSAGFRSSGLALPLGNYHNQAGLEQGRKAIGPEHVAVADFKAEIQLLLEVARQGRGIVKGERATRAMLEIRARRAEQELRRRPLQA